MSVFSFLAMLTSFVFMIGLNVVLFEEEVMYGIGGIIGMIGFVIAYSISGDMILAPRDFWFQSSWGIFKKKMGYAFSTYILVACISAAVLAAIFN